MEKDTGGQAFPKTGNFHDSGNACYDSVDSDGMTLRDYFAAKAMHGYISTAAAPCIVGGLDGAEDELAKGAYKMADAMLRARGQQPLQEREDGNFTERNIA